MYEKLFQINNGDTDENQGNILDEDRIKINNFYYTRSFITDELNKKSNDSGKMNMKLCVAIFVTFLLGALSMGISIGILEFKHFFLSVLKEDGFVSLNQQVGKFSDFSFLIHLKEIKFSPRA